jgi:hypothetical protein
MEFIKAKNAGTSFFPLTLTMKFWLSAMAMKTILTIGLSRIHGVLLGVRKGTSKFREMSTCAA